MKTQEKTIVKLKELFKDIYKKTQLPITTTDLFRDTQIYADFKLSQRYSIESYFELGILEDIEDSDKRIKTVVWDAYDVISHEGIIDDENLIINDEKLRELVIKFHNHKYTDYSNSNNSDNDVEIEYINVDEIIEKYDVEYINSKIRETTITNIVKMIQTLETNASDDWCHNYKNKLFTANILDEDKGIFKKIDTKVEKKYSPKTLNILQVLTRKPDDKNMYKFIGKYENSIEGLREYARKLAFVTLYDADKESYDKKRNARLNITTSTPAVENKPTIINEPTTENNQIELDSVLNILNDVREDNKLLREENERAKKLHEDTFKLNQETKEMYGKIYIQNQNLENRINKNFDKLYILLKSLNEVAINLTKNNIILDS